MFIDLEMLILAANCVKQIVRLTQHSGIVITIAIYYPNFNALRGFGGPQAMFATEAIVQHAAEELHFDVDKIREMNFYSENDCTPFGMHLYQCNIQRCWHDCIGLANYEERKKGVEEFNSKYKYRKRGIHLTPTKFGIGFGFKQLNQVNTLSFIQLFKTIQYLRPAHLFTSTRTAQY